MRCSANLYYCATTLMIPGEKIRFRKNDKFKDLANDLTSCFEIMRKYRDASVDPNPDKL